MSRIPSPGRSQSAAPQTPPGSEKPHRTRSVDSPALPNPTRRLSSMIQEYRERNRGSFVLSPLPRRSILTDNTDIEEPRRRTWWDKLEENSRDAAEMLEDNKAEEANNIHEEMDLEIISQEKKDYTLDLPESSGSESINSIVIPQRRLFTEKENVAQKKFEQFGTRDTLNRLHKTNATGDNIPSAMTKELFRNKPRSKPFSAALLNISPNKTTGDKTLTVEVKGQTRNIFGKRQGTKRKNMFANFIVSESEDEIPDIQPKIFEFPKKSDPRVGLSSRYVRDPSPSSSITTDMELDNWKLLPSSTMVENQLEAMMASQTPKRAKLSKLSEAKESETGTNSTETASRKDKSVDTNISASTRSKSNKVIEDEDKRLDKNEDSLNNLQLTSPRNNISQTSIMTRSKNKSIVVDKTTNDLAEVEKGKSVSQEVEKIIQIEDNDNELNENESIVDQDEEINKNNQSKESVVQTEKHENSRSQNQSLEIEQEDVENHAEHQAQNLSQEIELGNELNESQEVLSKSKEEINEIQDEQNENSKKNEQNRSQEIQSKSMEKLTESPEELNENQDEQNRSKQIHSNSKEQLNESHEVQNKSQKVINESEHQEESEAEDEIENVSQEIENESEDEEQNIGQVEAEQIESENEQQNISQEENEQNESEDVKQNISQEETEQNENEDEQHNISQAEAEQNESEDEQQNISQEENEQNESEDEQQNISQAEVEQIESEDEQQNISQEQTEQNESEDEQQNISQAESEDEQQNISQEETEQNESEDEQENISQEETEQNESEDEQENISQEETKQNESEDEQQNISLAETEQNESDDEQQNISQAETEQEVDDQEMECDEENESGGEEAIENDQNEDNHDQTSEEIDTETPNVSHDTTGRSRNKYKSPEALLRDSKNQADSYIDRGQSTSIRKTKSMAKTINIRHSLEPVRESIGLDGTKSSSDEGSGWDSHRTTRKTLRQTFGKDFTPRKSLRAMVMEKSAKKTLPNDINTTALTGKFPLANSTELPGHDDYEMVSDIQDSDHEVSGQMALEMCLQMIQKKNMERRLKIEEAVKNSLKAPSRDSHNPFKVPAKPAFPRRNIIKTTKPMAKAKKTFIPLECLPEEVIEDMKYKPPKRFQPSNAAWITKRLYKYLETKLEPKYDYKARVRSEKLVETLYQFAKDLRRRDTASADSINVLKQEMARLKVVQTHFDFYEFFHEFMPREIRIKVVPDAANNIPVPRHGVFADIINNTHRVE